MDKRFYVGALISFAAYAGFVTGVVVMTKRNEKNNKDLQEGFDLLRNFIESTPEKRVKIMNGEEA